jgi:hypothetical protein
MGVYRGPAETGPRQGLFMTHPIPGLGAAATTIARVPTIPIHTSVNPGSRICPSWGCGPAPGTPITFQSSNGVTSSPSMPTTSTPVVATNTQPLPAPVQSTPPVSSQTTVTPTTTALPTPAPTGVALTSGAASTAQAGTPVPVNWPTNQTYTDQNGYIWAYTPSMGWQVSGIESGSPAATAGAAIPTGTATAAGTTVDVSTGLDLSDVTTWLQEDTIVSSIPNFFFVAGAGVLALVLMKSGKR